MLNYIWAGLIIISLVFALIYDARDLARDTYRNEQPLPVTLRFPEGEQPEARRVPVEILLEPAGYAAFYGLDGAGESPVADRYSGYIVRSREGVQLRFDADAELPEPLLTIRSASASGDDELQGTLALGPPGPAGDALTYAATVTFAPVRFVKLRAITQAAFDFAETAVSLALGLIGVLALFLGLLKIAEASGIVYSLVKVTQPLLRPLFPEIPDGHPALGMIVLNLTANVLGLGNAATPLGIKAMEELQKLNPKPETATNSMVMLLAMNTASVQLVPPTLLIAIMGLQINELIFAIIIVTLCSLTVAILAAKLLSRLPGYRADNPMLAPEAGEDSGTEGSPS